VNYETRVGFADEKLKKAFDTLSNGKFEDKQLHQAISKAIDSLKKNPECGIRVPKKLSPKYYETKYGYANVWKYDLPEGWRLIYSLQKNQVLIVSIILEWLDHKNYERRFRYKPK